MRCGPAGVKTSEWATAAQAVGRDGVDQGADHRGVAPLRAARRAGRARPPTPRPRPRTRTACARRAQQLAVAGRAGSGRRAGRRRRCATSRARGMNGAMARKTNRHFGQCPHQRALASRSLNARCSWSPRRRSAVNSANSSAMCSSDSGAAARSTARSGRRGPASAARSSPSASTPLDHWWLISWPFQIRLGSDAERSLDITTGPSPCSTAVATAISELIAVTGMCPLQRAGRVQLEQRRVEPAAGGQRGSARTPRCTATMTWFGLTENGTGSSPARAQRLQR